MLLYTCTEIFESVLIILFLVLKIYVQETRLRYLSRSATVSCECLRFITAIGIAIELLEHDDWLFTGIGIASVYILVISFIKLVLLSIFMLLFCYILRNYLVSLRAHRIAPLDREILNNFISEAVEEGAECSICLENYNKQKEWVVLPCNHSFDQECMEGWVTIRGSCPVCRKAINQ